MNQIVEVKFKKDRQKSPVPTYSTFKSQDIETVEFHLEFDGFVLDENHSVEVFCKFKLSDTSLLEVAEISDGKAIFKFDSRYITRAEQVYCSVYVRHNDKSIDVRTFVFDVELSERDKGAKRTAEIYDGNYNVLLERFVLKLEEYRETLPSSEVVQQEIDEILNAIRSAEASRGLAETDRKDSETTRKTNEVDRVNAEQGRIDAEIARVSAEVERLADEEVRLSAETARGQAEQSRESAELIRVGNESNRVLSELERNQQISDFMAQLGIRVATLDENGKLSAEQIPALAINDTFVVNNISEVTSLIAQRGDVAVVMHGENVSDAYILTDDASTLLSNWVKLGVSYVAEAGHAQTSTQAVDSQKIGGHYVVTLTQSEYDVAVKDPNTIYLVGGLND